MTNRELILSEITDREIAKKEIVHCCDRASGEEYYRTSDGETFPDCDSAMRHELKWLKEEN